MTVRIEGYSLRDCTTLKTKIPEWAPGGKPQNVVRTAAAEIRYWDETDAKGSRFRILCIACGAVWERFGSEGGFKYRADGLPEAGGGLVAVRIGTTEAPARCSCAWGQARWPKAPDAPAHAVRQALETAGARILETHGQNLAAELAAAANRLDRAMEERKRAFQAHKTTPESHDPPAPGAMVEAPPQIGPETAPNDDIW